MGDGVRSDGYYRWFPGDYLRDTGTLSLVEHGAYRLLLDHYYSESGGISDEKPRLYRLCRATTPEEQQAVDFIVSRYFPINNGKLTNARADREIMERAEYIEEQRRKGKLGGRPSKKAERKPGDNPKDSSGFQKPPSSGKPNESPASASASASRSGSLEPEKKDQERIVTRTKSVRFTPPTLQEVSEYCKTRGNTVDPIKWHAHYTANGWRVGKNKMQDWKAAVVTWERGNG